MRGRLNLLCEWEIYFEAAEREREWERPGIAGSVKSVKEDQGAVSDGSARCIIGFQGDRKL
jgi:hypothetical protein